MTERPEIAIRHAADAGREGTRPAVRWRLAAHRLHDVEQVADWRERLHWPISTARVRDLGDFAARDMLLHAPALADPLAAEVVLSGAGRLINDFLALYEAAMLAQAEARDGLELAGGPPELAALRGSGAIEVTREYRGGRGVFEVVPVPRAGLRAIARTSSWTPWPRLPLALLAPQAVAISHNGLLRASARDWAHRVKFRHGQGILVCARRAAGERAPPAGVRDLPAYLAARWLAAVRELEEPFRERLRTVFEHRTRPILERIALDVLALREYRALPRRVWSGTTSAYVTRMICREVLRRGGDVTSFDHGGDTAISQLASITAIGELASTSRFIVGTERWAKLVRETEAPAIAASCNRPDIGHASGDLMFRAASVVRGRRRGAAPRPRVLYVGHPFRGFRQFAVADPPDTIYWDFQQRVIDALKALPVDLVCKPHPEGIYVGQRNPIEAIAPTSYKRFEEHLHDTDVFVFDAPTSTTFAEALCTDRAVVLLDRNYYPFNPALDPMIRARCRIVAARPDASERILFDADALRAAVCEDAPPLEADFFRSLLAGAG